MQTKTMGIKKKIIFIIVLSIALISACVCALIISTNIPKTATPTNTHNEEVVDASVSSSDITKYLTAIYYTAAYRYQIANPGTYIPKDPTKSFDVLMLGGKTVRRYYCGAYNDPNNKIEYEDTLYKISSADDYNRFVNLTNYYESVTNSELLDTKHEYSFGKNLITLPNTAVTLPAVAKTYAGYHGYAEISGTNLTVNDGIKTTKYRVLHYIDETYDTKKHTNVLVYMVNAVTSTSYFKANNLYITTVLTTNIYPTFTSTIRYYKGIFNGQGNTIAFQGSAPYDVDAIASGYWQNKDTFTIAFSPFISSLAPGGGVRNLCIDYSNTTVVLETEYTHHNLPSYAAGIVGCNKGTIHNCKVVNPGVSSNRYADSACYAPITICCCDSGRASYCEVSGVYSVSAIDKDDGIKAFTLAVLENELSFSLFSASINKSGYTANIVVQTKQFTKKTLYSTLAPRGDNYALLGTSVVGGKGTPEDGSLWYYAKGHNKSYESAPRLRLFVPWKEVTVKTDNGTISGAGTISKDNKSTKVLIPLFSDNVPEGTTSYISSDSTYQIAIYEQVVTVTTKWCHTNFIAQKNDTLSGDPIKYHMFEYVVSCVRPEVTVTIQVKTEGDSKVESKSWTLDCGTDLSCYATGYSKPNAYKKLDFVAGSEHFNVQPPSIDYYIEADEEDVNKWGKLKVHYTKDNDGRIGITINIKKKTYNVSVKK